MKYGIYYFSGTGNSLWSANKIALALGDSKIYPISQIMAEYKKHRKDKDYKISIDDENMVLVYPAYAYEAPLMVRRFVKMAQINSKRICAIVTYGSHYGGALAEIKRILRRKNLALNYSDGIKCVENYIPLFGGTNWEEEQERIIKQAVKTDEVIQNIKELAENKIFSGRIFSMAVSSIFRIVKPVLVGFYKVGKNCNGCGICEKVCPAKAIVMKETKKGIRPKFKRLKCEHCMACFNYCPKKATALFRLKEGAYRFNHPEVPLNEILKQSSPKINETEPKQEITE